MHKTRRQIRQAWRGNPIRRWTHILWSLLTGLVLSRAAFVSPIARHAVGAGPEDVKDVEVMPVLSPEATVEIIGENTSAPVRLLYSPGVQSLLSLLSKLQNTTEETSGTCLQALLRNIPKVVENVSEQEIPSDLEGDFEEALQALPEITTSGGNFETDTAAGPFLQKLSRLRLVKRLPEIAQRLAPFEVLYPDSLAKQSKIETQELKEAFEKASAEVREADPSSWSVAEFEEAAELFKRNPVCKEVGDSVSKNIEESLTEFYGQTTTFALGFLLAQILFFGALVAACCGAFGGGGSSDAPVADVGLPLHTLGGKFS